LANIGKRRKRVSVPKPEPRKEPVPKPHRRKERELVPARSEARVARA
jgi:hypothetical protein